LHIYLSKNGRCSAFTLRGRDKNIVQYSTKSARADSNQEKEKETLTGAVSTQHSQKTVHWEENREQSDLIGP
jgi:hypothetical protein